MTSSPNEPGQSGSEKKPAEETETSAVEQTSESSTAAESGEATSGADKPAAEEPGAEQDDTDNAENSEKKAEKSENSDSEQTETSGETGETTEAAAAAETGVAAEAAEEPAKKKSKVGMYIAVAASVLVLAIAGVGAYWLFAGGSAQKTAEDYAALSTKETQDPRSVKADDYKKVVCTSAMPQIEELQKQKEEFLKVAQPKDLEMLKQVKTSVKGVQENGDSGTATMESTVPGQQPQTAELKLIKEDGDWKLCA